MERMTIPDQENAMAMPAAKWMREIGWMPSVSEARRALEEGSVKVNGRRISPDHFYVQSRNPDGSPWAKFMTVEEIEAAFEN